MFLTLLGKECKQYLKSATYYIFLACLLLDYITQMGTFDTIPKPELGQDNYGYVKTEDKGIVMQGALESLVQDYYRNNYITYPVGFFKEVQLNKDEKKQVKQILLNITGLTSEEFDRKYEETEQAIQKQVEEKQGGDSQVMATELPFDMIEVKKDLSYQSFLAEMEKVDDLLGGGSDYTKDFIEEMAFVPATYEQAMESYESLLKDDKITNAYARLFCDYMGITLAILPIFLAVTRALRDRKAKAEQVIFIRKAGSVSVILSRFLASVIVTVVPVFLLSCSTLLQAIYYAKSIRAEYDLFAFVKHIGFWLLPTILICLSVGFFLTELTDGPIAIFLQGIWWFASLSMGGFKLVGKVGWNLVPRFNTIGDYAVYQQMEEQLIKNRCLYAAAAFLLVVLTIMIFDKKRKGEFVSVGTMLRNRKNKLEA